MCPFAAAVAVDLQAIWYLARKYLKQYILMQVALVSHWHPKGCRSTAGRDVLNSLLSCMGDYKAFGIAAATCSPKVMMHNMQGHNIHISRRILLQATNKLPMPLSAAEGVLSTRCILTCQL